MFGFHVQKLEELTLRFDDCEFARKVRLAARVQEFGGAARR